tara:strand:- start:2801 stop:3853 length:1053 start_codon:yes stop_codon:yes gene_type:complete
MAPFLLSDQLGRETGRLNSFGYQLGEITSKFENLFIEKTAEGTAQLTKFGAEIRDSVIMLLQELSEVALSLLNIMKDMNGETNSLQAVLHLLIMPIRLLTEITDKLGDGLLQGYIMFRLLKIGMIGAQVATIAMTQSTYQHAQAKALEFEAIASGNVQLKQHAKQMQANTLIQREAVAIQMASNLALFAGLALISKASTGYKALGYIMLAVAGAFMAASMARMIWGETMKWGSAGMAAAMVTGAATMVAFGALTKSLTTPAEFELPSDVKVADLGMRMYDMGGIAGRHFPVMVEPGETIIPKTQNMLSGGSGITLNIQGDIVTNDAEDFAERIAEALPEALRMQNDIGGI